MRKCQLHREGKIRLLYKLIGMEILNKENEDVHAWHDRYKGYHVFSNKLAVENRFLKGDPLSCFCMDGRCNEFTLHSKLTNLNEEETNMKSLTCRSVIRHRKCILTTQECSFVDLFVLMRYHQL